MSHKSQNVYSTFRSPQASKERRSFLHGSNSSGDIYGPNPNWRGRGEGRSSEGIYGTSSFASPASNYGTARFSRKTDGGQRSSSSSALYGINGDKSKIGNGFQTVPSSLYKGAAAARGGYESSGEGIYATPSVAALASNYSDMGMGTTRFSRKSKGDQRPQSVYDTDIETTKENGRSKLGNGFQTVPSSLYRGQARGGYESSAEGIYATPSVASLASNYSDMGMGTTRFSRKTEGAHQRQTSLHDFGNEMKENGNSSKLGNGFQTVPSSLYRSPDPLNNVNRFSTKRTASVEEQRSLNNFDYYRNQEEPQSPSYVGNGYNMSYQHSKLGAPDHHGTSKPKPENKPSLLLSPDENRFIFDILGRGRQTLATAVGRLLTPTPDQQQWQVKDSTGAVCLVRDTTKKSYFIQVFSLRAKNMIFRQEIYNQFEYQMPQNTFMTFEGDSSMVAILFADSTEASNFRDALDGKLEAKRQRRNERETRKSRVLESQVNNVPTPHYASNNVHTPPSYPNANGHTVTTTTTYTFSPPSATAAVAAFKSKKSKAKEKDNKKKTKLTAKDIGTPMDFRHVQHVGWDPNKGFDLNLEDKDLRTFFEKAGVSANQLNDENTRKFIYNFIEQHGVVDLFKKSANSPRAPPPVPSGTTGAGPPPVPTRTPSIPNSNYPPVSTKPPPPPPPPSRPVPPPPPAATYPGGSAAGPPPPPVRTTSSAPTHPHHHHHQASNGPSRPPMPKPSSVNGPSSAASPPPPPPPPMPVGGGAPPPPPPPPPMSGPPSNNGLPESNSNGARGGGKSLPAVSDDRSNLLKQIQQGIQLKKVDVDQQPKRTGGISDCLSEIQRGVDLKKVPESAKAQPSLDAMDGLAGALARALADRQKALNPDSSSSDDEAADEYDDEEWE